MKIIAIKKMSAGNDCVGEMWDEVRVFDENTTLKEVMNWNENTIKRNVILVMEHEAKPSEGQP